MLKKLVALIMIVSIVTAFGITAYAAPDDKAPAGAVTGESAPGTPADNKVDTNTTQADTLSDEEKQAAAAQAAFDEMLAGVVKDVANTDMFLITIKKPDKDKDAAYEKSYVVTGIAKTDIRVCLYKDSGSGYEPLLNNDGSSTWDVAEGYTFSKEIILQKGANNIKVVAYSTKDPLTLDKEDIQVNSFTISLLEKPSLLKNAVDAVKNTVDNAVKSVTNLISGNKKK